MPRLKCSPLVFGLGLVLSGIACSSQPAEKDTAEVVPNPAPKAEAAPTPPPAAEGTVPVPAPTPGEPK